MRDNQQSLSFTISDSLQLNLCYMPFINNGGIFIPTSQVYSLGDTVLLELNLLGKKEPLKIEGRIIWISPPNSLYHVLPGVGIQFTGEDAQSIRTAIEAQLNTSMEVGGYTYGITEKV